MEHLINKPERRRRLPHWSMATMFMGVTIVCLVLGLVVRPAVEQKRALEYFERVKKDSVTAKPLLPGFFDEYLFRIDEIDLSGRVVYGGHFPVAQEAVVKKSDFKQLKRLTSLTKLNLYITTTTDRNLKDLSSLTSLTSLNLGGTKITDVGLEHLTRLMSLTSLNLGSTKITEVGLQHLTRLTSLTELKLRYNRFTAIPPEIGQLTRLTELWLDGNQIRAIPPEIGKLKNLTWLDLGDNQFTKLPPEIGKLTKLETLELRGNPITDADLEHLKSLKKLNMLYLYDTKVTEEGIADLQRALPGCSIYSRHFGLFFLPIRWQLTLPSNR